MRHDTHVRGSRSPFSVEILNEMPRLKDQFSVTFQILVDQETKTSANIQSDLPWGTEEMQYDPKDSKQHMTHDSLTRAKGATARRITGVSDEKALRLRDEQEGARTGARLQSGKWSADTWVGTRSCSPAEVETGLPASLPRMCLGRWRHA